MDMNVNKRTLQEVFASNFHEKFSFSDFLELTVSDNIKATQLHGRKIIQPSDSFKRLLHFLVKNVFDYASVAEAAVFSYRKGVNIRDAVLPHSNNRYFYQTDVANFFGSITKNLVENALKTRLDGVPISDLQNFIPIILGLVTYENNLPLGFPTSPSISNICLYDFDNELASRCEKMSIVYTRYADDIILSSSDEDALKQVSVMIDSLLKVHVHPNINLNTSKTRYLQRGQKIKLLGLVVLPNGQISIDKADKSEIETLLYLYLADATQFLEYSAFIKHKKTKSDDTLSRESALAMLSGRLLGANAMVPEYVLKLRQKYGNTIIDMFLHKSAK
jgi:RNA-directed DNA polymerase